MLRAAGDATRLRLLLLLLDTELTVSELTQIVGQSQPRVSRHLKVLCDAGLLERFKEGSWVFYRGADRGDAATLAHTIAQLAANEGAAVPPRAPRARNRPRRISRPTRRIGSASVRCRCPNPRSNPRCCGCSPPN